MQSLLPILLIILTLVILYKHYDSSMKTGEKMILVMIFILVSYTCYSYMKLEGFADYKASITKDKFLNSKIKIKTIKKVKKMGEDVEEENDEENDEEPEDGLGDGLDRFDNTASSVQSATADAVFAEAKQMGDLAKYVGNSKTSRDKFANKFADKFADTPDNIETSGVDAVFNPSIVISRNGKAMGASLYDGNSGNSGNSSLDYAQLMQMAQQGNGYPGNQSSAQDTNQTTNSSNSAVSNTQYNYDQSNDTNYKESGYPYAGGNYMYYSDASAKDATKGVGLDGRPLLVFPKSKLYYPGFQYVDPVRWDVPQRRPGNCIPRHKTYPPAGVVETKFSFLEYNEMGKIADQEGQVTETNVGSIMPPFVYKEMPYASP